MNASWREQWCVLKRFLSLLVVSLPRFACASFCSSLSDHTLAVALPPRSPFVLSVMKDPR